MRGEPADGLFVTNAAESSPRRVNLLEAEKEGFEPSMEAFTPITP
jgi:hypothetical protein